MKILFCTDGSKISFNALKNFADWVKEAIVDTICVIDWSFLPDEVSVEQDGFASSCANVADGILDFTKNIICEEPNLIQGEKFKHCGAAVESILEQLKLEQYDFVVLGSHGKKGIQKWLGSVSQEIVESTRTSSYIAKHENKAEKILFTTDGTHQSFEAIKKAVEDFNLENKKIYICMVNESPDLLFLEGTLDSNWLLSIENQQKIYAAKAIKDVQDYLKEKCLQNTEAGILTGNPAQKIIDFARSQQIDLIILGSTNKTKMDKFLMGSVSKRVLENVQSDVLIVKNHRD